MKEQKVILISGRTMDQGRSLEVGKTSEQYFESVAIVELSISDADALEVGDGDPVEVSTAYGSVVVRARRSEGLDEGMIFFPYGPWANRVFGASTGGTGMPSFKGIKATIRPGNGKPILNLMDLVDALKGGV